LESSEDSKMSEQRQKYTKLKPSYERLAHEVQFTLDKQLREAKIKFSAVTHRAKTEESLREKLTIKSDYNSLEEITDLAGVRIVYLYSDDFERIREIISKDFEVIETVDKLSEQGVDKFGYVAVHFIVHLGEKSSGARYDDLKSLKCEIQVRTVLQDAWAIINHHLMYKQEQDVPNPLLRKVNSLAGLLEAADYQFDYIRSERKQYTEKVELSLATDQGLDQEINVDTLVAFLKHYFLKDYSCDAPMEDYEYFVPDILDSIDREKYKTLGDLKNLLDRQAKLIKTLKEINTINGEARWGPSSILYSCMFNHD
jgi:putative GTP pyrophosphokinase